MMLQSDPSYNPYEDVLTTYTATQVRVLSWIYYVTPPISMLGSTTILYAIYYGRLVARNAFKKTFLRLTVGFCVLDLIQSAGILAFGPWAMPVGTPYVMNASGNIATCNLNGFFTHLAWGLWIYSACLACYHTMTVRFQWQDDFLERFIEPIFHGLAWLFPLTTGTTFMLLGLMNPIPGVPGSCAFSNLPAHCQVAPYGMDVECYRGENSWQASLAVGCVMMFCMLVIPISFILLYRRVREIEKKIGRFGRSHRSSAARLLLTARTGRQALKYISAFLVCNIPFIVSLFGPDYGAPFDAIYYFIVTIPIRIFFPLQGFFNALIFVQSHPVLFEEEEPLHFMTLISIQVQRFFSYQPPQDTAPNSEVAPKDPPSEATTSPSCDPLPTLKDGNVPDDIIDPITFKGGIDHT